jgi:hypothetical protein
MFDGGEREHPTRPEETVHVWRLMVQERDPARRPQAREAPAKPSASPVARGDGWRGPSSYRRAMNERSRAPAGEDGALPEDTLEDLYR